MHFCTCRILKQSLTGLNLDYGTQRERRWGLGNIEDFVGILIRGL